MTSSPSSALSLRNLHKHFDAGRPGLLRRDDRLVHAVDGVDLDLGRGEILALVGESGCGKSTLALTLLGLERPTSGEMYFEGTDVARLRGAALKDMHKRIQMVFQDPYESLNPMMTIEEIVEEPLIVHRSFPTSDQRRARVIQALEDAGLKPADSFLDRLPHQLSGGQRQRVVIAASLVLDPTILLADEPVSMLDVSIRAEILNLLADLRARQGISILFITHDFGTVAHFADRIAVMYLGRIVEIGRTEEVLRAPRHPYTKALLSVVPVPNPRLRQKRTILQGETPNPIDLPTGCRFHPRCPIAEDRCRLTDPPAVTLSPSHSAACLLIENDK
ncbi:MAG: ABC transporter ATP-binding protein [Anaerolineae bacterium]|nr:MAG: ABC transporter ATP-binding protein [Anaerolineae bacterium]